MSFWDTYFWRTFCYLIIILLKVSRLFCRSYLVKCYYFWSTNLIGSLFLSFLVLHPCVSQDGGEESLLLLWFCSHGVSLLVFSCLSFHSTFSSGCIFPLLVSCLASCLCHEAWMWLVRSQCIFCWVFQKNLLPVQKNKIVLQRRYSCLHSIQLS